MRGARIQPSTATVPATLMLLDAGGDDFLQPSALTVLMDRDVTARLVTVRIDTSTFVIAKDAFQRLLRMRLSRALPAEAPLEASRDTSIDDLDRVAAVHGGEIAFRLALDGEVFIPVIARLLHRPGGEVDVHFGHLHARMLTQDLEQAASTIKV